MTPPKALFSLLLVLEDVSHQSPPRKVKCISVGFKVGQSKPFHFSPDGLLGCAFWIDYKIQQSHLNSGISATKGFQFKIFLIPVTAVGSSSHLTFWTQ